MIFAIGIGLATHPSSSIVVSNDNLLDRTTKGDFGLLKEINNN
jgi:hypothetical protein